MGSNSMSVQDETITSPALARPNTRARLRKWAARRTRQLLRVLSALTFVLVLCAAAVFIWRQTSLVNLPDIGDPFDVATMRAGTLPGDRDAFVIFRQAKSKLGPLPGLPRAVLNAGPAVGWSKADPKIREWVEANREALDLFKVGAEQPDGWAHPLDNETAFVHERMNVRDSVWLALLEGSRLEERGDMAGAWAWYRTVLVWRAHVMRRGTGFERLFATLNGKGLQPRVAIWAANPKTHVLELRRALDDVIACEPKPEWEKSSLKVEYVLAMRELDRSDRGLANEDDEERAFRIGGAPWPANLVQTAFSIRRFLLREPERSRRVLRLAFANWLAHAEIDERHRKPAVRARFRSAGSMSSVFFYAAGPAAPAAARRLLPQDLAQWLVTAPDAKRLLCQWPWPSIALQERRDYRALMIVLAEELYRRAHGRLPSSEDDLVGTYLKALPDDGAADLDDGTAPTVDDSRPSEPARTPK